jgi:hypothetical protein
VDLADLGYTELAQTRVERNAAGGSAISVHDAMADRPAGIRPAETSGYAEVVSAAATVPRLRYSFTMQHAIDPKIDCVFKALLGAEGNRRLLIHFLNAALGDDLPADPGGGTISTGCFLRSVSVRL